MDFLFRVKGLVFFIEVFIKSSIICGVALLLVYALRKQSASIRHFILSVSIIGLLILPVTIINDSGWNTGIPSIHTEQTIDKASVNPLPHLSTSNRYTAIQPTFQTGKTPVVVSDITKEKASLSKFFRASIPYTLIILWTIGIIFCISILTIGIYGTSYLTRKGVTMDRYPWKQLVSFFLDLTPMRRKVRVIKSPRCNVPMTCGVISPVVVVPHESEKWTLEQCSSVLFHELSHVKRKDFLVRIISRFTCALYWFNPICWEVYRSLKREQEKACDEMVLKLGVKPSMYASHLLEMRRTIEKNTMFPTAAIGIADPSEFKDRLLNILKKQINLKEVKMKTKIFIVLIGLMVILFIGSAKANPLISSEPVTDEKTQANLQELENLVKKLEIQKIDVEKTIDERIKAIGNLNEKEIDAQTKQLELKLKKTLEQLNSISMRIDNEAEKADEKDEDAFRKLEDSLMKMEEELDTKIEKMEELHEKFFEKQDQMEAEQMKHYQGQARKMELEMKELEKKALEMHLQSKQLEKEAKLLAEKQKNVSAEESKKFELEMKKMEMESRKLEEMARKLEKEAEKKALESEKLDEELEEIEPPDNIEEPEPLKPATTVQPPLPPQQPSKVSEEKKNEKQSEN